jgi:hypothetical protein
VTQTLKQSVINEDHELEDRSSRSMEALAKHRWHWTLDESNAGRVGEREYARQVGRTVSRISLYARGYETWAVRHMANTLTEAMEQARVGAETYAATKAIAEVRGVATSTVRQKRPEEVKRVRQIAQAQAERRGTSVEAEAPRVAKMLHREEQTEQERVERRRASPFRYVQIESELAAARRSLARALVLAGGEQWLTDEREVIQLAIDSVRKVLDTIDRRIANTSGLDMEAEINAILAEVGD